MLAKRVKDFATPAVLALVLLAVLVLVFQVHRLEQRFIAQGQQLRELGEATERLGSSGGLQAARTRGPEAGAEPNVKLLHPEVENLLKPADTRWPPPGRPLDGVLRRGWYSGDPKGFNSMIENAAEIGGWLEAYCSLPIARRNGWTDPDVYHGELAWRVEITDDYKEFTIYLRKGVKWHPVPNVDLQGKHAWLKGDHEVTAQDLVFTFDMLMHPQVDNGSLKNYYAELESWKAVDSHTFVLRWKKKQRTNLAASMDVIPMPEFVYAHDESGQRFPKETMGLRLNQHWYNNKGFLGVGPYRMVTYQPGVKIELARNEAFIGDKPAIASIVYPIYTDMTQTLLKLKARELSMGPLTPGQYREEIQRFEGAAEKPRNSPFFDGRIECRKSVVPGYRFIAWNGNRPLFADKRVRRALTQAFDRQRILDSVFVGLGTVTSGPYLPDIPFNDPAIKPWPFDLAAARKLLSEAGWTDSDGDGLVDKQLRPGDAKRTPFEFTLMTYGGSKEWSALANIFREDLLKIGIRMSVDTPEWSLMQKRLDDKAFDAFTLGWASPWEVDLFQIWHSSQADTPKGSNYAGFRNAEADKIIVKLRETFDPSERTELLRAFHRIVHEEQPYSFFIVQQQPVCFWNEVKDVVFSKMRPVDNTLPWSVVRSSG